MSRKKRKILENNLRNIRVYRGITQTALAKAVGVSRQSIWALEKGYECKGSLLLKIAQYLRVPADALFYGYGVKHDAQLVCEGSNTGYDKKRLVND